MGRHLLYTQSYESSNLSASTIYAALEELDQLT